MMNMALNHPIGEKSAAGTSTQSQNRTAGSAPPMATIKAMQERLGWQVIQIYGLTETSPFLTVSKVKSHMGNLSADEKPPVQTRTGYPMLGIEVRVLTKTAKTSPLMAIKLGKLIARANVVMRGYWRDEAATDNAMGDGWFHSGDMATLDNEGYIEIVDRKKDLIISGGENISSNRSRRSIVQTPSSA